MHGLFPKKCMQILSCIGKLYHIFKQNVPESESRQFDRLRLRILARCHDYGRLRLRPRTSGMENCCNLEWDPKRENAWETRFCVYYSNEKQQEHRFFFLPVYLSHVTWWIDQKVLPRNSSSTMNCSSSMELHWTWNPIKIGNLSILMGHFIPTGLLAPRYPTGQKTCITPPKLDLNQKNLSFTFLTSWLCIIVTWNIFIESLGWYFRCTRHGPCWFGISPFDTVVVLDKNNMTNRQIFWYSPGLWRRQWP